MSKAPTRNDRVAMTATRAPEMTADKATARRLNPTPTDGKSSGRTEELLTVADQIAGTNLYCRNWKFRNAEKHFPLHPLLRRTEKYYVNAKGGPLLVDEPKSRQDVIECELKAKAMKTEQVRYVYIVPAKENVDQEDRVRAAEEQLKRHMEWGKSA